METADATSREQPGAGAQDVAGSSTAFYERVPVRLEPDLEFIEAIRSQAGPSAKQCFQCGTCSTTCEISPDIDPFPRKEMAWASWGLKDRLLKDPDVWLCHQCNDCTMRCPRGARPGDVLAAVRREAILHYARPQFLARWMRQPKYLPLLLAIPATLLAFALALRDPLIAAFGITRGEGEVSYSFSSELPHWLLNGFFGFYGFLALVVVILGIRTYWRAMMSTVSEERKANPAKPLGASIWATIKSIFRQTNFQQCKTAKYRYPSHIFVFFGFLALMVVTFWVITGPINPLIDDFIYPWGFLSPWKMLANLGGLCLLYGLYLMFRDRWRLDREGVSRYFDWTLLTLLLFVVLTGFGSEIMHFARMEPHRHLMYFMHLVLVFALLMYMPYSKFAHIAYRTTAMVFAEHMGRGFPRPTTEPKGGSDGGEEESE